MKLTLRFLLLLLAWAVLGPPQRVRAQTTTLDFTNAAATSADDWKAHAAVTFPGSLTTVSSGTYTTTVPTGNNDIFTVGSYAFNGNPLLPSRALSWIETNATNNTGNVPNNAATVTFTFSVPVANLTLRISDIDASTTGGSEFIDRLTLDGYNTTSATPNTAITLSAANFTLATGGTNAFSSPNSLLGTGNSNATAAGTATVTFPSLVNRLTLTYRNLAPGANNTRLQAMGIESIAFAANADVVTTLSTGQTAVQPGATITYTATVQNNGPATATGVAPQVQLPAGLAASTFTLPAGATYNNNTGLVTLPTTATLAPGSANALTYPITFTAPNYSATLTGTASSVATSTDPTAANNNGTAANANVQTVVTLPSNGCAGTPYSTAGSGLYAEYYASYFNDNLGFFAASTPGLTRTDALLNYAATNSWGNLVPPGTGSADNADAYSSRYRGSISIATAGTYTFSLTSDDASFMWLDGAALAATPTLASATISNGGQHGAVTVTATVTLAAGPHNLLVFYGENGGQNSLVMQYSGPDTGNGTVVIPNSKLCPTLVNVPPVALNVTNSPVIPNTNSATTINALSGTDQDGTVTNYTILTLPTAAQGVLTLAGVAVTAGQTITAAQAAQLQFNPSNTFSGNATFTFQALDNNGQLSNNTATYTIPVAADVLLTTLQGPTAGTVGQNVTYTATTTNLSPAAATSVVPTVQLPANLNTTGTVTVSGGTYNNATGLVTYATVASLAAGASVTNLVTYVPNSAATVPAAAASTTTSADNYATNNNGTAANANVSTVITAPVAASCATPGKDGSPASLTTNPVAYYATPANASACTGATTLTLGAAAAGGAATNIAAGDLLLIVQMQGADIDYTNTTSYGDGIAGGGANGVLANSRYTAGQFEYVTVASGSATAAAGGTVTLASGLKNCYDNAASTATAGQRTYQVLRVPQYGNLTLGADLTVTPWNGSTGGIFVVDVTGTLNFNGRTINASGAGFRGGATLNAVIGSVNAANNSEYVLASTATALKGEGTAGTPAFVGPAATATGSNYPAGSAGRGAPGNAGAAGTRNGPGNNQENGGGGGGANAGLGGRGGNSYSANQPVGGEPGANFIPLSPSRMVLGGGGGAGDQNNSVGSSGAAGGGMVLVRAGAVTGAGTILANGASAAAGTNDGVGGGGAGGSVLLTVARGSLSTVSVSAQGGNGGNAVFAAPHGTGGGGGGGIVFASAPLASSNVSGGANGVTGTNDAYGAAPGQGGAGPAGATGQGVYGPTASPATFAGVVNNSVTGTACQTDVTTTLTGPNQLAAGQASGTFTATFSNVGGTSASGVTQTVTLPAGATVTAAQLPGGATFSTTGSGTTAVTTINFGTATLAVGASNVFSFSFTAPATTGTPSIASNTGTTPAQNANLAPDTFSFPLTVSAVADVAATVTGTAPSIAVGSTGTFNVAFTNLAATGPNTAAGVVASVQLPAGLNTGLTTGLVSASNGGVYDNATGLVTYAGITSLTSGQSVASVITYTQPNLSPVTATATISTTTNQVGQVANDIQAATNTASAGFDLATTLTGPATAVAGTQVTYGVTTSNNGPGTAPNAIQTVSIPTTAALTNVFLTNGGTYSFSNGTSVFSFPAIPALGSGQQVNNSISFTSPGPAAGSLGLTALATPNTPTAGDVNTANNQVSITTNLTTAPAAAGNTANLNVAISSDKPNGVAPNTPIVFTVTQGNSGPNTATSVMTQVYLPTGLTGVVVKDKNGNTLTNSTTSGYNALTGAVIFPTEANQASGSTPLTYTITANAPASGVVTATATVAAATNDIVPADNVALAAVTVNQPTAGDVATSLSGPATASPGESVVYTVSAVNNGTTPATGVLQTVQLPAGLTGVVVRDANGNVVANTATTGYNATTGLVTYNSVATLAAGASLTRTITFAAPDFSGSATGGSIVPVAAVSTTSADNVPANNTARVTTTIKPISDLTVSLSGPATAVAGNPVTYTVTTTNNGASVGGQQTTVQLPAGLDAPGSGLVLPTGASYNAATGLLTLAAVPAQGLGLANALTSSVTFNMPLGLVLLAPTAQVTAAAGTNDANLANNAATVATTVTPATELVIDLATTVTSNAPGNTAGAGGTQTAGQPITFTVTATNNTAGTSATNAVQQLALAAGLSGVVIDGNSPTSTTNGISTYPGGTTYNANTGVVTFAAVTLVNGTPRVRTVLVNAPSSGPLVATATVKGDQTDAAQANNTASTSIGIAPSADLLTTTTGPATTTPGTPVSYSVVTTNNGPSSALNVVPTLVLPAGATNVVLPPGATYTAGNNTVTFATVGSLANGQKTTGTVTFTSPATAGTYAVNGNVTSGTADPAAGNNASSASTISTAPTAAPVAFDVIDKTVFNAGAGTVNSAMGNTAGQNFISPLSAGASTGRTIAGYTVTAVPPVAQGTLYYNSAGTTYTAVVAGQALTPAQAASLKFDPADNATTTASVGDINFSYTATDDLGNLSNTALYTIPVAKDNNSFYSSTPNKGGATQYQTNDVLAYVIDPNGASYNSAGLVYNTSGTTANILVAGAKNGLVNTANSVVASPSGSGPAASGLYPANPTNALPAGVSLDPVTGLIYVSNRALLVNNKTVQYYQINVTTTDIYGGINLVTAQFSIGAYPLPVELTDFTATAVRNVDASLVWHTASEKNNDHFDVERSLTGTDFVKIGQVRGQGTTSAATAYALTDAGIGAKATGLVYYRLKQVDVDGTASYSPVRTVSFTNAATLAAPALSLYPNPATTATALALTGVPAGSYQVSVLDATGRVVLRTTLDAGLSQTLDLGAVASGTYVVLVRGQVNGQVLNLSKRLIKE